MNLFTAFKGLLPKRPLQVGTVIDVSGGVCTIELPDGGLVTARGEASVDDLVFFRDGAVEGTAPVLPLVEYDI